MKPGDSDDWEAWWDARTTAMERVLGQRDGMVGHATVPLDFGTDLEGAADVVYFRHHLPGVVAVTSELIGRDDQAPNGLGNYELMICARDEVGWGASIISKLAHYTLGASLNSGETMDIGSATPAGSTITAVLFLDYARFDVLGRQCGLLLCLGITADELDACRAGRTSEVQAALKAKGVYPYTSLFRPSTLGGRAG
jgi:Suppressor of fused protein (SUFU)